jgi:hypothetical protein
MAAKPRPKASPALIWVAENLDGTAKPNSKVKQQLLQWARASKENRQYVMDAWVAHITAQEEKQEKVEPVLALVDKMLADFKEKRKAANA